MTLAMILFTALGAVLLVPYIYLRSKRRLLLGLFFKIGISVLFLLTAAAGMLAVGGDSLPLSAALVVALLFGLLGDVFLDQKDMYGQHRDTYTFAGFLAFLAGHFFFIAGLFNAYEPDWKHLLLAAAGGLAVGLGSQALAKPMKMDFGKFKAISAIYGFVLTFMMGTAFACYAASWAAQALWMGVGGALFLLSDLVLSRTYFGKGHDKPIDYILNYVLYYGAQFTIALSLAAVGKG